MKPKLRRPSSTIILGMQVGPTQLLNRNIYLPTNYSPYAVSVGGYVLDPIAAQELAKYLNKFAAWAKQEKVKKKKRGKRK